MVAFAARATMLAPLLLAARPRPRALTVASAAKKVVFLGTPEVAARSLELILQGSREGKGGNFEIAAVVSQPPARTGRKMKLTPSPVHALAESEGLTLLTPPNAKEDDFLRTLEEMEPDLMITAAYGCFLPQRFLDIPKFGTLNIHPSLLPLYRGAAPVQRCLENGDAVSGVTVAFTVLAMDAGPVLRQVERPLDGNEMAPDFLLEMFEVGSAALLEALPSVWDGSCEATLVPQDGDRATKCPKVKPEEAEVRLDAMPALAIHNRCRGFAGWPGIWTELDLGDGKGPVRCKLTQTALPPEAAPADVTAADGSEEARTVALKGKALQLTCGDGSVLLIKQIQLPGKKPVDAKSFWNGLNGRVARWVPGGAADDDAPPPAPPAEPRPAKAETPAKRKADAPASVEGPPAPDGFVWGGTY
jgi:methionyl-tRNA formyltransferase